MSKLDYNKYIKNAENINEFFYILNPIRGELVRQQLRSINKKMREEDISTFIKESNANELNIQDKTQNTTFNKLDFDSNIDLSLASNIINQAIKTGLVVNSYSGLLKCNINISELAKSKDGMLRGFKIATHGGIEQQAKFIEVGIPTPIIAFQVASFITGQYYQHIITEQLEIINEKLDDILGYLLNSDKSTIIAMFNTFKSLYALSTYKDSDFNLPKSNLQKLEIIRQNYMLQLKEITCKVEYSKLNNLSEAKSWEKFFYEKKIGSKMNICYWAEILHYMYCVLLVKMEINREDSNPYDKKIERANMYYNRMDNTFGIKYSEIYHTIKNTILCNLELLYIGASYGKDDIKKIKNSLESNFKSIETLFIEGQKKLNTNFYYKYENGIPTGKLIEI